LGQKIEFRLISFIPSKKVQRRTVTGFGKENDCEPGTGTVFLKRKMSIKAGGVTSEPTVS
jgi:hypothetical protein